MAGEGYPVALTKRELEALLQRLLVASLQGKSPKLSGKHLAYLCQLVRSHIIFREQLL